MIVHTPCPPASRLDELLGDALPADERAELVRHLDLSTRAKVAAKKPPQPLEPEFCI